MPKITRNFTAGRMNKVFDERVVPNGEYIDAMNIRMGSTENSEIGSVENTKGNLPLTYLVYTDGTPLSIDAKCIGAIADGANELIYWFVHDPNFTDSPTGKLDMIVSYNTFTNILTYHVVSVDDGGGLNTTLNFNSTYLITGVNFIEDLLFFTDDYNPPRVINVKRNYPNPLAYLDQFSAESILVIKRPPSEAPIIDLLKLVTPENYLEDRFICFAYRYRYADGEYSATSQWTAPAFTPNPFDFSLNSVLNEGMVNRYNAVKITYNTGSPLVVGIDLLFKQANNNIIKVIEKLDKKDLGIPSNTVKDYVFTNSKIFTILPESEMLRLYDNVPLLAKAQTIMGNRLMYGNYVEGYDLIDKNGYNTKLDYVTTLVSEEIGSTLLDDSYSTGSYTVDINTPTTVNNSILNIDLSDVELVEGSSLSFELTLAHDKFTFFPTPPTQTNSNIDVTFSIILKNSYASVYEFATSTELAEAIGTYTNVEPMATSCDGITLTDNINCLLNNTLAVGIDSYTKYGFGITDTRTPIYPYFSLPQEPIKIIASSGSDILSFQFTAAFYSDGPPFGAFVPPYAFEYFKIISSEATFQKIATPRSLHSNRGYEVGIVYMDEFNRSTTALVSYDNTVFVPCGNSSLMNSIEVTIPPTQVAPSWATRYKFVIKPDQEGYETIYSQLFFTAPETNDVYFLLEGENARKVEQGDRLIVKADSSGPLPTCAYATVLEKEAKISGFITPGGAAVPPAGVYMKIKPNEFSTNQEENDFIVPGVKITEENTANEFPLQFYPMNIPDPANPGMYIDYDVPSGSRIKFNVKFQRLGTGSGNKRCEKRIYTLDKIFIASRSYDNMYDWFIGDNIASVLNDGIQEVGSDSCGITNNFYSGTDAYFPPGNVCINQYKFFRDPATNQLTLRMMGTIRCAGYDAQYKRRSSITTDIQVFRINNEFIFETLPQDALPDVFYENDLSFSIDENGNHMGNIQNQNIALGVPAIVDTQFFNCFAFGNGAESYKIRDSIVGRTFNLGNRVTSVSAQDYKQADRFADITYSGVYNPESNVNKLNEFNLGLLNFKNLEVSFGAIYVLDGRETDVLVLQEDKISYVLAGKNLLSDAAAGGAITSVPEVLGTQIARTEKYGISFNPESYVQWGYDRYFTDVKRGAVIQLIGNAYSNEQIKIVSEMNMRSWFRDTFIESFNTQKLGGFDPYMNEYVLSINTNEIPSPVECLDCGVSQTFSLSSAEEVKTINYCVDFKELIGFVNVNWNVLSIEEDSVFDISVEYNGDTTSSGETSESGFFIFNKDTNEVDTANITISYSGIISLEVLINCPVPETLNIVEVVLTSPSEAGDYLLFEYRYTNGTFVSPLQSNLVAFASGGSSLVVSRYAISTGPAGTGGFPPALSTMRIQTNNNGGLYNGIFLPADDRLKYLRSNTLYTNTTTEINALLSASSNATPILGGPNSYYADFTVPISTSGQYLYLIWDLRSAEPVELCYSEENTFDLCCDCAPCTEEECIAITIYNEYETAASITFNDGLCGSLTPYVAIVNQGEKVSICVNGLDYTVTSGNPAIIQESCGCTNCTETCSVYYFSVDGGAEITYTTCGGGTALYASAESALVCVQRGTVPVLDSGNAEIILAQDCGCPEKLGPCMQWSIVNNSGSTASYEYLECSAETPTTVTIFSGQSDLVCSEEAWGMPKVISGSLTITVDNAGDCTI
jgi:hypothetical protein